MKTGLIYAKSIKDQVFYYRIRSYTIFPLNRAYFRTLVVFDQLFNRGWDRKVNFFLILSGQSEGRQHSTMITSQIIERDSDASSSDTEWVIDLWSLYFVVYSLISPLLLQDDSVSFPLSSDSSCPSPRSLFLPSFLYSLSPLSCSCIQWEH